MLRGHPGIASGVRDLRYAVGAATVRFECADDAGPAELRFRDLCQQLLVDDVVVDEDSGARGWSELGPTLAAYWLYGHAVHAPRVIAAPGADRAMAIMDGRSIEMYPVHSSTIQSWDGRAPTYTALAGIRQQTRSSSEWIPAESIIHMQHGGAPGEWEGESVLRPLVFLFERWVGLLTSAERMSSFASGVAIVTEPPGANEDDRTRLEDSLIAWMQDYQPILVLPHPYTRDHVDMSYPSGTGPDVRSQAEYIDGMINAALGRALHSLGYTAHGSRALGESIADADAWTSYAQMQTMLDAWGSRAAAWLARTIGYRGRIPSLRVVDESSPDMAQRVTTLSGAVGGGLLTWGRNDEHELRQALGLGPVPEQPVTPARSAAAMHDGGCGCGSCAVTLADDAPVGRPVRVIDAGGEEWWAPRELRGLEVYVRWAEQDREFERMTAAMTAEVNDLAVAHRAAVWSALAGGYDAAALARTYDAALTQYRAEVERYATEVLGYVQTAAGQELAAQQAAGLPVTDGGVQSASGLQSPATQRLPALMQTAADEMANRVQTEVERAWASGVTQQGFTSQITPDGLARAGKAVGERVLAEGRVIVGAQLAPGVRIIGVTRTGIRDTAQCPTCRARDGAEFALPEQEQAYRDMPLPDPDCDGGVERCRCGWLVEWGRVA